MQFISTRGQSPAVGFCDSLLTGLAPDGGLYVPQSWPRIDKNDLRALRGAPYQDIAEAVLTPYVSAEISATELRRMIDDAYAQFHHRAIAPLVQLEPNHLVLELFHGPTLAFKDIAMQLLSRLMDDALEKRQKRATIVAATSGDTGGAAIEAFRGRENIDIFVLFPNGRVSPVQQRQMTTASEANVHALAIDGTFDDCQSAVKAMFNNHGFRDRVQLSAVNSINWARIVAQIVYYFSAALTLGGPDRSVSFTVPTGNFGDIFAGYAAAQMGLPIDQLVIATNVNDILTRSLATGRYETREVTATQSPSMDIQVSSNFERLLFDAGGGDANRVCRAMECLRQSGGFQIDADILARIRDRFGAGSLGETQTRDVIADVYSGSGYVLDPHSAVGVGVARGFLDSGSPMITLATAHPAKFPGAVNAATGLSPKLPERLNDLMDRQERLHELPDEIQTITSHIEQHARAAHPDTAEMARQ